MSDQRRGRHATRPTEIPAAGWKDVLWRVYGEIGDDRVLLTAAGVTFYLLLAMIPGLSALISTYGLVADPSTIQGHLSALQGFVPSGGMDVLKEQLNRLAGQKASSLSLAFAISLVIALWSANAGMKALFEAMNVAYDEKEERGFIKLTLVTMVFTIVAIIGVMCLVGVVVVMPSILQVINLGGWFEWLIRIASYVGVSVLGSIAAACLYRWGPSRAKPKWRWITPGSILSVGVILIVSALFSWYVANFGSYNATYGSLGALIGFLTWIWITVTILIIGGELNSEMEHQTYHDTTTPPDRPFGSRDARMADTIGESADGSKPERGAGGEPTRARTEDRSDDSQAGSASASHNASFARRARDGSDPFAEDMAEERRRRLSRDERVSTGLLGIATHAALALLWTGLKSGRPRGRRRPTRG